MPIVKQWDNEIQEYVEVFVENKIDIFSELDFGHVRVTRYTEEDRNQWKRNTIAYNYNACYGTRFKKFDKEKQLSDAEFESMCNLISKGYSLKESYYISVKNSLQNSKKEEQFNVIKEKCKFLKPCYEDGILRFTCRNIKNIPEGKSWGDCMTFKCPIIK